MGPAREIGRAPTNLTQFGRDPSDPAQGYHAHHPADARRTRPRVTASCSPRQLERSALATGPLAAQGRKEPAERADRARGAAPIAISKLAAMPWRPLT